MHKRKWMFLLPVLIVTWTLCLAQNQQRTVPSRSDVLVEELFSAISNGRESASSGC